MKTMLYFPGNKGLKLIFTIKQFLPGLLFVVHLTISLPAHSQGMYIQSGAYVNVSGSSAITLANGNLSNSGTYTSGTETLYMTGTSAGSISGSNTTLKNLEVSNTGGITNQLGLLTVGGTLTVASGSKLAVASGKALTVNGATTLNGSESLVIATEGSFIDNGSITYNTATARVEKSLAVSRWWYIGSPMTSAKASSFGALSSTVNTNTRLFYWNEGGYAYVNITDGNTTLDPMKGYSYKNFAGSAVDAVFTGTLNTGSIGSSNNLTRKSSATSDGFNLVCNPYPSAVNWGSPAVPASAGLVKTNIWTTIWYRTNSSYATYNSYNGANTNGGQQYIPALQAFWVNVYSGTSGTLQMDNTTRVHQTSVPFYKESPVDNVFRLMVKRGELQDETVVGFYNDGKSSFEVNDSQKMFSTDDRDPQIYTLTSDDRVVAINGLPEIEQPGSRIVPLGFVTGEAGQFTLEATNMDEFDPGISVALEDKEQNIKQDLRKIGTYIFNAGVTSGAGRFRLHFGNAVGIDETGDEVALSVYTKDNILYVNCPSAGRGIIELYTLVGQRIGQQVLEQGLNQLQAGHVARGVYIVKIQAGNTFLSQKVIL